MYVPKVSVRKPHNVFKIGKTFSSTKSDLQVESSSRRLKCLLWQVVFLRKQLILMLLHLKILDFHFLRLAERR
jgi:hypothetical protein